MNKIGIADNICITETTTTCGSKMLENFISPYDATVIEKLKEKGIKTFEKISAEISSSNSKLVTDSKCKENDVISMSEFNVGANEEIAKIVSSGKVDCAIGSDMDGKLRITASKNKVIAFKPTFRINIKIRCNYNSSIIRTSFYSSKRY